MDAERRIDQVQRQRQRQRLEIAALAARLDALLPGWTEIGPPNTIPPLAVALAMAERRQVDRRAVEEAYKQYSNGVVRKRPDHHAPAVGVAAGQPRIYTADREVQATTVLQFLEVLRLAQSRSGRNPGQIAAVTGIPRASAYALVDPRRTHLPTKAQQLIAFLQACRLPEHQVTHLMRLWNELRTTPAARPNRVPSDDTAPEPTAAPEVRATTPTEMTLPDNALIAIQEAVGRAIPRTRPFIVTVAIAVIIAVVLTLTLVGDATSQHVMSLGVGAAASMAGIAGRGLLRWLTATTDDRRARRHAEYAAAGEGGLVGSGPISVSI